MKTKIELVFVFLLTLTVGKCQDNWIRDGYTCHSLYSMKEPDEKYYLSEWTQRIHLDLYPWTLINDHFSYCCPEEGCQLFSKMQESFEERFK